MNNIEVISNLDDNTKLISIYKNDVDGHPVIGYAYAYLTLTTFEKLPILLAAQEVIFEELKEAYLELSVKVETPKREPLSDEEKVKRAYTATNSATYMKAYARAIEKAHGIGGEPLSNEQKRLEAIAIKQREAHSIEVGNESRT